uniref:type II toxin-antitoxin system RelE/ParE family toxin n=1 Tax=Sphingomonas sp. TaxID=28214 RepID=UPI0025E60E73|nr:type II toxin-antitoxin system RelE/ParE family toxin [Sphingomonas sp.]
MQVAVSRKADADLDDILDYGIATHGRTVAEAYLRTIDSAFDMLGEYPELGMMRPDLRSGLRSLPAGEHRVFYVVLDDRISIVRVLHKAMDAARYL